MHQRDDPSNKQFQAPWGRLTMAVSLLVSALLVGTAGMVALLLPGDRPAWRALAGFAPLVILAGAALYSVRGYTVANRTVVVRRLCWGTSVSLAGFQSATIDPDAMRGSLRLLGNGGLFAFCGLFRNRKLGMYRAFVTDPQRCVVLRVGDRALVMSPDRPEDFVRAVNQAAATG